MDPASSSPLDRYPRPFWILELSPSATDLEVEKAARTLTAKLTLGVPDSEYFATPRGRETRDEYLIRDAKTQLLDPSQRLLAEFWYRTPKTQDADGEANQAPQSVSNWLSWLGVKFWQD